MRETRIGPLGETFGCTWCGRKIPPKPPSNRARYGYDSRYPASKICSVCFLKDEPPGEIREPGGSVR